MKKSLILTLTLLFLASHVSAFEFCEDGIVGENKLRLISVDDMLKGNSKEWTWQSSQQIEIEARVENRNDESGTYILQAIFKDGDTTIHLAERSSDLEKEFSLSADERKSISLEFVVDEDVDTEEYDLYIKFYKRNDEDTECTENSEEQITIEKIIICDDKVDEDDLELTKIIDELADNGKEWEWISGDEIEISLELENKAYSQRDFAIELVFLDEDNEEVSLADDSDDIRSETNIDEDESDDINFRFKLRANAQEGEYALYAKAYDQDNRNICTSLKAEDTSNPITIKLEQEDRKVIMTKIEGPRNATISSQVQYTATLTNFGSKDEDKVLAILYNYKLNIEEEIEIQNLDSGEQRIITFDISIPQDASLLSKHILLFSTRYQYDEKLDHYESFSDGDDDAKYRITILEEIEQQVAEAPEGNNITDQIESITEDETDTPTTIITGNAIGIPEESPNWIVLTILIILAIIGIILFFKKPHAKKQKEAQAPPVIRRYTAKID
jgi:hypothetical protein